MAFGKPWHVQYRWTKEHAHLPLFKSPAESFNDSCHSYWHVGWFAVTLAQWKADHRRRHRLSVNETDFLFVCNADRWCKAVTQLDGFKFSFVWIVVCWFFCVFGLLVDKNIETKKCIHHQLKTSKLKLNVLITLKSVCICVYVYTHTHTEKERRTDKWRNYRWGLGGHGPLFTPWAPHLTFDCAQYDGEKSLRCRPLDPPPQSKSCPTPPPPPPPAKNPTQSNNKTDI